MSNFGINSNIYYATSEYLTLLNGYLSEFTFLKGNAVPGQTEDVLQFLEEVANKKSYDPDIQMISLQFENYFKSKRKRDFEQEISLIREKIKQNTISEDTLKQLEDLADILKGECVESYSRMQGY